MLVDLKLPVTFSLSIRSAKNYPYEHNSVESLSSTSINFHFKAIFEGLKNGVNVLAKSVFCPQVNGTEIEYEFEEITLERVSIDPTAIFDLRKSIGTCLGSEVR